MQNFELNTWLPENLMMKADKVLMAHSLEGRFPFLDLDLYRFAASLPQEMKLPHPNSSKHVLRNLMAQKLPESVINRPKMGFTVPPAFFLRKLRTRFRVGHRPLARPACGEVLDLDQVARLMQSYYAGEQVPMFKVWNMFVLLFWFAYAYPLFRSGRNPLSAAARADRDQLGEIVAKVEKTGRRGAAKRPTPPWPKGEHSPPRSLRYISPWQSWPRQPATGRRRSPVTGRPACWSWSRLPPHGVWRAPCSKAGTRWSREHSRRSGGRLPRRRRPQAGSRQTQAQKRGSPARLSLAQKALALRPGFEEAEQLLGELTLHKPSLAVGARPAKKKKAPLRLAVYTVLLGDKEPLGNPLAELPPGSTTDLTIDFVCFTDSRAHASEVWSLRYLEGGQLPAEKLSRRPKALPDEYLPDTISASTSKHGGLKAAAAKKRSVLWAGLPVSALPPRHPQLGLGGGRRHRLLRL